MWTTKDTIIFFALAVVVGVPLLVFSLIRIRRAAEDVRASLQQAGYVVVSPVLPLVR